MTKSVNYARTADENIGEDRTLLEDDIEEVFDSFEDETGSTDVDRSDVRPLVLSLSEEPWVVGNNAPLGTLLLSSTSASGDRDRPR